ncbi:MAG: hypothetical protein H6718_26620 [Polyangiaceae bacterium]|nr:hypothetical protein [Polyangiaceae bacterium]
MLRRCFRSRFGTQAFTAPLGASVAVCATLSALALPAQAQATEGEGAAAAAEAAPAQTPPDSDKWDGDYDIKYTRRSDVMLSLTASGLMGFVSGYPNDVDKIDQSEFKATTGAAPGWSGSGILGVAFRDWLSFGVGYSQQGFSGNGNKGSAYFFLFRTEAYPLFNESELGKNLGFAITGGLGNVKLEKDGENTADGGAVSMVGLGAFWEGLQAGQLSVGPALDYQYVFSEPLQAHLISLGVRGVFYGGP